MNNAFIKVLNSFTEITGINTRLYFVDENEKIKNYKFFKSQRTLFNLWSSD